MCAGLQVDDEGLRRRYHFRGSFWLSTRVADCQISRDIPCSGRSLLLHLYPNKERDSESDTSARDLSETLREDKTPKPA